MPYQGQYWQDYHSDIGCISFEPASLIEADHGSVNGVEISVQQLVCVCKYLFDDKKLFGHFSPLVFRDTVIVIRSVCRYGFESFNGCRYHGEACFLALPMKQ